MILRINWWFVAALVLCATPLWADDSLTPKPAIKSPQAKAAIAKATRAADTAAATYRRTMAEIRRIELIDLRAALATATKASNLDEANAIKQIIDAVSIDLAAYMGEAQTLRVAADKPWQTLGTLTAGRYHITAEGRWSPGPDTWCGPEGTGKPTAARPNLGLLIAKFNGKVVDIGTNAELMLDADGDLLFEMSDGGKHDNSGEILVTIVRQVDLPNAQE